MLGMANWAAPSFLGLFLVIIPVAEIFFNLSYTRKDTVLPLVVSPECEQSISNKGLTSSVFWVDNESVFNKWVFLEIPTPALRITASNCEAVAGLCSLAANLINSLGWPLAPTLCPVAGVNSPLADNTALLSPPTSSKHHSTSCSRAFYSWHISFLSVSSLSTLWNSIFIFPHCWGQTRMISRKTLVILTSKKWKKCRFCTACCSFLQE